MKSTLKTMMLSLGGISLVAGAILAGANELTREPIAIAAARAKMEAMKNILPAFDNDIDAAARDIDGTVIYTATLGGKPAGYAVATSSDAGFGGRIDIIAGFDNNGVLCGYSVLSHAETPGLGAKMDEWFRAEGSSHNVIGTTAPVKVKADGGDIDAITGATITSRAFTETLNKARTVLEKLDK